MDKMKGVMIICLALAFIAAAVYLLMAAHVITIPRNMTDAPKGIVYIAAGCYALGGLLIPLRKQWLWIFGLVMNTLVMAIFFMMYNQKPEIMFSLPGLATKLSQILLEAGLIYLVATYRRKTRLGQQTR
jgi:hypothetical protein